MKTKTPRTKKAQPFEPWESALMEAIRSSRPHTLYRRCIRIFLVPRLNRTRSTWRMRQSYSIPSSLSESLNNTKNSAISYIRSTRCLSPAPVTAIPAGIPACLVIIPLECKCRAGNLQVGCGIGGGLGKGIDKVFSVEIQFNIYALPGGKIEDAMQWNQWLPNLNGLIMGQVVGKERNTIRPSELRNFLGDVNRALHKETDVGGYATNSQIYSHPYNFVSVRNQSGFSLTLSQVAAHEVGHTLSVWHIHCKDQSEATQGCNGRDFEYSSEGLGSNTYPYVSNKNLLNIINDKGNRGTIK
jgi:hypothetical protein